MTARISLNPGTTGAHRAPLQLEQKNQLFLLLLCKAPPLQAEELLSSNCSERASYRGECPLPERGLKPATTSVPKRITELVVAGFSPRLLGSHILSAVSGGNSGGLWNRSELLQKPKSIRVFALDTNLLIRSANDLVIAIRTGILARGCGKKALRQRLVDDCNHF